MIVELNHCGLAATALLHGGLTMATGFLLLALRLQKGRLKGWIEVLRLNHTLLGVLTCFYGAAAYLTAPV